MVRIAFLACLLISCGADRAVAPSGPVDTGIEEGIAFDSSAPDAPGEDAPPDELLLEPKNRTLTIDSAAPTAQTIEYKVSLDAADVTATSLFSLDEPSLGTFAANVLTTQPGVAFTGVGKTFVVTARDAGKRGRAKLTLVRLRTTAETKDFLFESRHGAAPTPDKELFRVLTTAANGGVGADVSVVLKNDPANPPGVDARKLVTVRAMNEGFPKLEPPSCEPQSTRDSDADGVDDTFIGAATPRALCFDVRPVTNLVVTAAESASFHRVLVDIVTSTGKTLQSRSVVVMVPATDPVPR